MSMIIIKSLLFLDLLVVKKIKIQENSSPTGASEISREW